MTGWERFWLIAGAPFRAIMFLVDLTPQQMKSLLLLTLVSGIVVYSWQDLMLIDRIPVDEIKAPIRDAIIEKLRHNFWLQLWFAIIVGLVAFGADWVRAKYGEHEIGFGKGVEE